MDDQDFCLYLAHILFHFELSTVWYGLADDVIFLQKVKSIIKDWRFFPKEV